MPKVIDHKIRKELIVKTALKVFAQYGSKETNLSIIAKECGLSRTTVYQYFKSVGDIYYFAVKETTTILFEKYSSPMWVDFDNVVEMIERILLDCYDYAEGYMCEIISLIRSLNELGIDFPQLIKRNTARIRLAISRAIRHGIRTGQIKKQNAEEAVNTIISLFGSYCFQRAYFPCYAPQIKTASVLFVRSLKA